jgi:hypothetical protein
MLPNSQTMMSKRARRITLPIKTARYGLMEARAPFERGSDAGERRSCIVHAFLVTNFHTSIPGNSRSSPLLNQED